VNPIVIGVIAAVVIVAAFVAYRILGRPVRCPFCREWLPRTAAYQIGRTSAAGPYACPYCNHVIRRSDLERAAS
jgi:hypothetical protein